MQTRRSSALHSARHDAGFTVAEFVAASAILFIVLVGVLGAVDFAGAGTRMAAMRQGAVDLASQQVETDRNIPWSSLGIVYASGYVGNPAGTVPATQTVTTARGTYTITTSVNWYLDNTLATPQAAYKVLKVTVAWINPSPGGSVTLQTNVFGQGAAVANAGDVLVTAVDVENNAVPTPGVSLNLDPYGSGSIMVAATDDQGQAVWSDVPIGAATFPTVSSPSYLVDMSGLGSPTIHTGFQNLGFIYTQVPRTMSVHVRSTSLANLANATVTLTDVNRSESFTAVTDSNGWAYFDPSHNTVKGRPGLWLSSNYTLTATAGGKTSPTLTTSLSKGCPIANVGPELTVPDPPTIIVSMKVSTTGAALTGKTMVVSVKDPSGTLLTGSGSTYTDTATFAATTAGNYTVSVTGVSGFLDNTSFVFAGNATGIGQACVVPMQPVFLVLVQDTLDSGGLPNIPVKVWSGSTYLNSTGGTNPGITGSSGTVGFVIPADASYNVSATVNGISYYGTPNPISLVSGSPPLTAYVIPVTPGTLSVAVPPGTGSWKRLVAVYDSSNALVTSTYATVAAPTPVFTDLNPGMYTVTVCGSSVTAAPSTLPANTASKYKDYPLTSPGVQAGATYALTNAIAPN